MKPKNKLRCAIYTRKSSEEGLDQQFNSLDAQREACESYIQSQKHEGWNCIKEKYDDGGFSGGNIQRPALVRLIDAIKKKLIDIIIVYKVDRLSRSLADFAKLVELFDEYNVSFVSVTQQFNTSNSMGRLTLNVLLSFAQFEREVTGERIRDKIAASKKKGMWMGGNVPLGYQTKDRKLIIAKKDAKLVQLIFNLYIEYKSVRLLKLHLDEKNMHSRQGNLFSAGMLYKLLQNPHYIGKIRHKEKTYDGEHTSIIDMKLWKQTQSILRINRNNHQTRNFAKSKSLLAGKLFDDRGNHMSPSHSNKNGKRHRYYVSQALIQHREQEAGSIPRINSNDIEIAVWNTLEKFLSDPHEVLTHIGRDNPELGLIKHVKHHFESLKNNIKSDHVIKCIEKVTIEKTFLRLDVSPAQVAQLFDLDPINQDHFEIKESIQWQLNGKGYTLLLNNKTVTTNSTSAKALKKSVIKALVWNQGLMDGTIKSISQIEKEENLNSSYIRRTLRLAYLPSDTLMAICKNKHDSNLILEDLRLKRLFNR